MEAFNKYKEIYNEQAQVEDNLRNQIDVLSPNIERIVLFSPMNITIETRTASCDFYASTKEEALKIKSICPSSLPNTEEEMLAYMRESKRDKEELLKVVKIVQGWMNDA